jgi:alpha-tubulin suppressor-like RCC1 family protein
MRHFMAVVLFASACHDGRGYFECRVPEDCRSSSLQGACEPSHRCSFADTACLSGRRYGEYAGPGFAKLCVEEVTDAAPSGDANPDGAPCSPLGDLDRLSAGQDHTCAVTLGRVLCWGRNDTGQLGDGTIAPARARPVEVLSLGGVTEVGAGTNFTCALTAKKTVACWGHNDRGQLGDGSQGAPRPTPAPVRVLGDVDRISLGSRHACAVKADHSVLCWGDNAHGQIGDGFSGNFYKEPVLARITGVVDLACGNEHTCALTSAGGVFCWGSNAHGEMGNPQLGGQGIGGPDLLLPTQLTIEPSVGALVAGHGFTCALSSQGEAWCWGQNDFGQVGVGLASAAKVTPTAALGVTGALALRAGRAHACAWKPDGAALCWGQNDALQIDGTNTGIRSRPVAPGLELGITAMALGGAHSCALVSGGVAWCWGQNAHGQLGHGTTAPEAVPTAVCP